MPTVEISQPLAAAIATFENLGEEGEVTELQIARLFQLALEARGYTGPWLGMIQAIYAPHVAARRAEWAR